MRNENLPPTVSLDAWLGSLAQSYVQVNKIGSLLAKGLRILGVGLMPVADHWLLRFEAFEDSLPCQSFGYREEGVFDLTRSFVRVFSKRNMPDILVQIPKPSRLSGSEKKNVIPREKNSGWAVPHLGVRVADLEEAVFYLEKQGIAFLNERGGGKEKGFRFAFADSGSQALQPTSLAVIERTQGMSGYLEDFIKTLDGVID